MSSPSTDFETISRRHHTAIKLESWELLAMHSIAADQSIPRVRLQMLKTLAGLSPVPSTSSTSAATSSTANTHPPTTTNPGVGVGGGPWGEMAEVRSPGSLSGVSSPGGENGVLGRRARGGWGR